ncbi:MAG: histidine kinase [Bacteroidetes bacterium GWF2_41_31]|nr:MAG: histidine kinase [Bacteroidetes bacterium GWF2_41_31]OFZ06928.1 MAG: histidine kinase [Bacteroidetes bacterium RIFOXYB12_FULL_41_6]
MSISINKQQFKFYLWVGFAYLLLWLFLDLVNYTGPLHAEIFNNIWRFVYIVPVNFIFFEFTIPFIKRERKNLFYNILLFLLAVWVQLMLGSYGMYAWRYIGVQFHIYTALLTFSTRSHAISAQAAYGVMSIFFFGIIKHIYDYRKLKEATQLLRIEKQEAELNYLKSQTNPHFLFNTLNNIYSLSRDKSDLAPESILRLSKILRFMLYETSGEFISVEQELEIINDYIELEKMRYDNSLRINFKNEIEDLKQPLPPLLLIPLVENAFKHGVSETRNQPFVDILLSVNKQQLLFVIKNSTENSDGEKSVKENIGLSNLRRQLVLLYKEYNLSVQQYETVFTATLKINLASHV